MSWKKEGGCRTRLHKIEEGVKAMMTVCVVLIAVELVGTGTGHHGG